ncbi:MAG: vitamin K epoxide reductase family protein [Flavobacterium sp.]|uniref:vitamin K epoxide reductase family protein n=1 Tax=Flavobacterium sp. TaxID=239 RepID=UPI003267DF9C
MIRIVNKYLDLNQFSTQKAAFEELFLSHPNYPSVFAITDSLDMLSIENIAIKIPKEQFVELPDVFLAIYKEEVVLVQKTVQNITIETSTGKQVLSFDTFLTYWNEVVVVVEPNQIKNDIKSQVNAKVLWFSFPLLIMIFLSFYFNIYTVNSFILLTTSILGFIVSVFIVQESFGIKNEVVSKFCNINPNTSCDTVIKSKQSKINKWVSFSDLPLVFFVVSVLSILIQPSNSSMVIGFFSSLSVPFIIYSIGLQKFKLKKWCLLCLAVSAIVVLQSLVYSFLTTPFIITASQFFITLFLFFFLASLWLFIKPVFETKIKVESDIIELKKFKRSFRIFSFLQKEIPQIKGLDKMEGLCFGNKQAEAQLTVILSPSCGHCHKTFEEAYNLTKKFPDKLFLNVLFNINPENSDNPYKIVVESLLSINSNTPEMMETAIFDWHIKRMTLEKWLDKWKVDNIGMLVNHQILKQYNWCYENEFNYTPVKIINHKLFPIEYEISDLKYFLNDFSVQAEQQQETIFAQL